MYSIASWSPSQSEPLIGVVHVPEPVVLAHVAERCADAALRRDRVRARRENLRQHRDRQARLGELQRRAHAGAAGADDDRVELAHGAGSSSRPPQDLDQPRRVADQNDHREHFQRQPQTPSA